MAKWKSNLRNLIAQKELSEQRRIPIAEVMRKTGLARGTVDLYMAGEIERLEGGAVAKLCTYLACDFTDLVELEIEHEAPIAIASLS